MPTCPKCKLTWGRSDEEHKLLFGVIGLAFDNWPHSHEFKPADAEHLRAWLAIEADHFEALTVPTDIASKPSSIAAIGVFLCHGRRHFRLGRSGRSVLLYRPLTMKKGELKVEEFRRMASRVYAIVEAITGITPEHYKAQRGKQLLSPMHAQAHASGPMDA